MPHHTPESRDERIRQLRIALLDLSPSQVPVVPVHVHGECGTKPSHEVVLYSAPLGCLYVAWVASKHEPFNITVAVEWERPHYVAHPFCDNLSSWDPGVPSGILPIGPVCVSRVIVRASPAEPHSCPLRVSLTFLGLTEDTVDAVLERARRLRGGLPPAELEAVPVPPLVDADGQHHPSDLDPYSDRLESAYDTIRSESSGQHDRHEV